MDPDKKTPAHLQIGLRLGTERVPDVIAWADRRIASTEEPSIELLELAMMTKASPMDVDGKVGELAGSYDPFAVLPAVLADAHSQLSQDAAFGRILARGLSSLYVDSGYDVPERFLEIADFDDEYALAVRGTHGTEEEIYQRLLAFTGRFVEAA